MREILFRGKRTDTKEWIEGIAFPHDNDKVAMFSQHPMFGILLGDEVDPETVGQFTGLTDKNGKKIFEGDIIEDNIEYESNRYVINYLPYYARFSAVKPNNVFCVFAYQRGEVIGNIYDNPELLGDADNETD